MIQEHWLFNEQLQCLNISHKFSSIEVSGMISIELITGRPYVGCAIIYRKTLSKSLTTASYRFCAISLTCSTKTILLICVYLATH